MSKPGKVLRNICKKLGIRLTVKRDQKRVYKSIAVLKRQCANKKVKRKRRRKFGSVKKLQMIAAEAVVDDLIKQLDDENSETFEQSYYDLYAQMYATGYPNFVLDIFVKKVWDKKDKIIEREKFEKYYNAWKKFLEGLEYNWYEKDGSQQSDEIRKFDSNYKKKNKITWYEIERFHRKINKIEKEKSEQNRLMKEKRLKEWIKAQEKKERERQERVRKEIEQIEEKWEKYKKAAYRERERKEIEGKENVPIETKEGEINKAVAEERKEAKRNRSRSNNNNNNNNRSSGSSNSKSGIYRNVYSPHIGLGLLIVVVILGLGGTGTFFLVKALGKEEDKRKRKRKK
tara:strand:+ start:995 stop:2023 length:1029 start_codon:yes stop_codon:yes gene_type:complete